jgi:type IV pilus assembly protein PilA
MSITTALKARRDALGEREAGFTLIELLIVVLIIGILAAIAIPVYLGVQNGAKDSGVKSDLVAAKTAITALQADNSGAPLTAFATNNSKTALTATGTVNGTAKDLVTYGFSESANTSTIAMTIGSGTANTGKWCLIGTSATKKTFVVTSGTSVVEGSACPTNY